MKELMEYDIAASHFYDKTNLNCLPFESWALSGSFFDDICKDFKSLNTLRTLAIKNKWTKTSSFEEKVFEEGLVIVVTDPSLKIVHASNNIRKMNGYTPEEVKGKRPSIFQGEKTDQKSKDLIRKAIKSQKAFETVVVNYKKDGSPYQCWIKAEPVFNTKGVLTNFIAYEKAVA